MASRRSRVRVFFLMYHIQLLLGHQHIMKPAEQSFLPGLRAGICRFPLTVHMLKQSCMSEALRGPEVRGWKVAILGFLWCPLAWSSSSGAVQFEAPTVYASLCRASEGHRGCLLSKSFGKRKRKPKMAQN